MGFVYGRRPFGAPVKTTLGKWRVIWPKANGIVDFAVPNSKGRTKRSRCVCHIINNSPNVIREMRSIKTFVRFRAARFLFWDDIFTSFSDGQISIQLSQDSLATAKELVDQLYGWDYIEIWMAESYVKSKMDEGDVHYIIDKMGFLNGTATQCFPPAGLWCVCCFVVKES